MSSTIASPYRILRANEESSDYDLRVAYRRLIHQFKADRMTSSVNRTITTEQFRKICRAYETLSDHDKRQRFNDRKEWVSDLHISKYTPQQLAAEPDLISELQQRLQHMKLADINAQDSLTGHTPLYCAARACNVQGVYSLIEQGADPDIKQRTGSTALHVAAFYGHPEIVRSLLECGASYQIKNDHGNLPEEEAYDDESQRVFNQLKQKPFVQAATNQLAWFQNNIENIKEHIDTQYHTQRQTLLHCASKKGYFDLVVWLIEKRSAKIDIIDINLNSALHLAAYGGHTSIVEYLLNRGANSILINRWGMTAEQEGMRHKQKIFCIFQSIRERDMFKMAHDGIDWWFKYHFHDNNIEAVNDQGTSLLYVACRFGKTKVAELLLDKGANINVKLPGKGSTPLHAAAFYGHKSTVELLISRRADISIRNQYDAIALDEANTEEIKIMLKAYGDNLAVEKHLPVYLYSDGAKAGNEPIAKVQLSCDATINDLIKEMPEPYRNKYKWFSVARSPLYFDDTDITLISAVCRARYVDSKFVDLPLCLITYNSPRYMNSGYSTKNELPKMNARYFHGVFQSQGTDAQFEVEPSKSSIQTYKIKNLLFTFPSCCSDKKISIHVKCTFDPDPKHFKINECVCIFQMSYNNDHDKLNDMPTVTVSDTKNVKLYAWLPNSGYWFSYRDQPNRLFRIGGVYALVRHTEMFSNALCLPPDMYIKTAIGQSFQSRQTPVRCQYLKICDFDPQQFSYTAYHGTSIKVIQSILMDGLVMPSTVVSSGFRVCPPDNHIPRGEEAYGIEDFANAIFVSPSIHYCSDPVYAVTFSHEDQRLIAVLECQVKKNSFRAFPSTVETYNEHPTDNINEIEWRITCPSAILITGILFIPVIKSRSEAARLRANKLEFNLDNF